MNYVCFWVNLISPNRCFLLYLLLACNWSVSLVGGAEENNKDKCKHIEDLVEQLSKESGNVHDYFGKPLNVNQLLIPNVVFLHFQLINKTNLSNVASTKDVCCQWKSEGCSIYVWFTSFEYLLLLPMMFEAFNSDQHYSEYLPVSICIDIPSHNQQDMYALKALTDDVSPCNIAACI